MAPPKLSDRIVHGVGFLVGLILFTSIAAISIILVYGAWLLVTALPKTLQQLDPTILSAVIATTGTLILGITALVAERTHPKARDIAEAHRAHKIGVYKSFFDNVIVFLQTVGKFPESSAKRKERKLQDFVQQFHRDSIFWASPKVLAAYNQMIRLAQEDPTEAMLAMDDLMREIRKDLGHSNRGLKRGVSGRCS